MPMPDPFLLDLLERASNLDERLGPRFAPVPAPDPELVRSRLDQWRRELGPGDPGQRLALGGVDPALAARAVAPARWQGGPLPSWVGTLGAVLAAAADLERRPRRRAALARAGFRAEAPVAFQEAYLPFLAVFRRRLATRYPASRRLGGPVWRELLQAALARLALAGTATLDLEFQVGRVLAGVLPIPGSRGYYQAFVAGLLVGGWRPLFREYPVLARLLATALEGAIRALGEGLERYRADRRALGRLFGEPLGPITGLRDGLSDPHQGGRTVLRLTTGSGRVLYYKPKSLAMDLAFQGLLAWLEAQGGLLPLRSPRTLGRGRYGWVEEVRREPCPEADAPAFYRRAGQLLGALYLLDANDMHYENVVAAGTCPVPIDLETLLHPQLPQAPQAGSRGFRAWLDQQFYDETVLRSGLLPVWHEAGKDRVPFEVSALGMGADMFSPGAGHQLAQVNSNAMAPVAGEWTPLDACSRLAVAGQPGDPWAHRDQVAAGFAQTYRLLVAGRRRLLARDGPLGRFRTVSARCVLRATRHYMALLGRLRHPGALRDGAEAAFRLELLARTHVQAGAGGPLWPALPWERRALLAGEVPRFTCACAGRHLLTGAAPVRNCFAESPLARVRRRLLRLDEADLQRQLGLIRHSLFSRNRRFSAPAGTGPAPGRPLAPAALVDQARQVAEALRASAWSGPGQAGAGWVGFGPPVPTGHFPYRPLTLHLYDGVAGVALFLAALEAVTGGAGFRDLALAALAPVRGYLREVLDPVADLGIGAARGLGSLVYALTRCAGWLEEPGLLAAAAGAAARLTPEVLAGQRELDVFSGLAGACLALLALDRAQPGGRWLEAAADCGDLLLARRAPGRGPRGWAFPAGVPARGFAYGTAGIAYALARLARATGRRRYRTAAAEAVAWEHEGPAGQGGAAAAPELQRPRVWCAGPAGVALGRAGALDVLDTPAIRREVAAAMAAARTWARPPFAHLCCGTLGLAEIAFTLGRDLDREDWRRYGLGLASAGFRAGGGRGALRWYPDEDLFNPGFFLGSAGLGYLALRLAFPEQLPCVLRFE